MKGPRKFRGPYIIIIEIIVIIEIIFKMHLLEFFTILPM
jgi:hypothetical protein